MQVLQLQKGVKASSAVDIMLQGMQQLISKQLPWEDMKAQLSTLLRFARYSNFNAQAVPISQIIQDTAMIRVNAPGRTRSQHIRETTLSDLKFKQTDPGYSELVPISQVIQDTALVRESTLADLGCCCCFIARDPGYGFGPRNGIV
jgi:hypothetical protein